MGFGGCENSQDLVQRFVEAEDLAARDDLIAKMLPIIQRVAHRICQQWWSRPEGVEDAVQETVLKLCQKERLCQWLQRQPRPPFCAWVSVVAAHTTVDVLRDRASRKLLPPVMEVSSEKFPGGPMQQGEWAARLRQQMLDVLSEFPLAYQLIFFMDFSYLEPTIEQMAASAGISCRTVFNWRMEVLSRIAWRCKELLLAGMEECPFVGIRHPRPDFESLGRPKQKKLNHQINEYLCSQPVPFKTTFYMKYSVLALEEPEIARLVAYPPVTIRQWLASLEEQIRHLPEL